MKIDRGYEIKVAKLAKQTDRCKDMAGAMKLAVEPMFQ